MTQVPFINLDAKYLSELAEEMQVATGPFNGASPWLMSGAARRLRQIAEHLEALDTRARHLPQKSGD